MYTLSILRKNSLVRIYHEIEIGGGSSETINKDTTLGFLTKHAGFIRMDYEVDGFIITTQRQPHKFVDSFLPISFSLKDIVQGATAELVDRVRKHFYDGFAIPNTVGSITIQTPKLDIKMPDDIKISGEEGARVGLNGLIEKRVKELKSLVIRSYT